MEENRDRPPEPHQYIVQPHRHDVLLGRGGLTNLHPGNNWYRCLVRSNRTLYETSPKHTKLLVAKAIVHHVLRQDPPGRFLEKQKSTGIWVEASYDNAVKKTSQALREKKGGDNDQPVPPVQDTPAASENLGSSSQIAADHSQNEQSNSNPPGLQYTASWFWRNHKKPKTASSSNPIPLPTAPLQERSSSLFRFFTNARLMEEKNAREAANTTSRIHGYQPNDNMLHNGFDQSMEPVGLADANASFFEPSQFMEPHSLDDPLDPNIFDDASNSMDPLPMSNMKRSRDMFESQAPLPLPGDAPSLTRLSTQVSDWLQSFWPVGDDRSSPQLQPLPVADPVLHHQPQPAQEQQQQQGSKQTAANPDLQQHLSVVARGFAELQEEIQTSQNGVSTNAAETIHQLQMQLQQMRAAIASLSNNDNQLEANSSIEPLPSPLPPPDLQPSVSLAIWNLACAPSRLFSGLSTLFSDSSSTFHDKEDNGGAGAGEENGKFLHTHGGHSDVRANPPSDPIIDPPNNLENNNSASLMPPPPLGTLGFEGNAKSYNSSVVSSDQQDPRFGRPSKRSLLDDESE